jgi:AcrR family transcriptional regulator
MSSWRDKQRAELQQHLFDTAIKLFTNVGFDETSVIQICNEAGVAKGTFFNYFTNKEAVLSQYMRVITAQALTKSREEIKETAEQTVLNAMSHLFAQARNNEALFFTICTISPHNTELQKEEAVLDDDILSFVIEQIEVDKNNNKLPESLESDVLGPLIVATLTATAHEWANTKDDFDPDREIERRIKFLFVAAKHS